MRKIFVALVITMVAFSAFAQDVITQTSPSFPIQLSIKSDKAVYREGEQIMIEVSFKNIGPVDQRILVYDSPSKDWQVFSYITVLLSYEGSKEQRHFNLEEFYNSDELPWVGEYIEPQKSISFTVPLIEKLTKLYPDFTLSQRRYAVTFLYKPDESAAHVGYWVGELISNAINIEVVKGS